MSTYPGDERYAMEQPNRATSSPALAGAQDAGDALPLEARTPEYTCQHYRTERKTSHEWCTACGRSWWPDRQTVEAFNAAVQGAADAPEPSRLSDDDRRAAFMAALAPHRCDLLPTTRCGQTFDEMNRDVTGEWIRVEDVEAALDTYLAQRPEGQEQP